MEKQESDRINAAVRSVKSSVRDLFRSSRDKHAEISGLCRIGTHDVRDFLTETDGGSWY